MNTGTYYVICFDRQHPTEYYHFGTLTPPDEDEDIGSPATFFNHQQIFLHAQNQTLIHLKIAG